MDGGLPAHATKDKGRPPTAKAEWESPQLSALEGATMGKNTFVIKDGNLLAVSYVRATRSYECVCGEKLGITIDWPEGLTQQGAISVTGSTCPKCSRPVVLPRARYWVDDFRLLSEPLD